MGVFVFVAGFAIGVAVTLLVGVLVDRIPNGDAPDVGSRPHGGASEALDNAPERASSHE